MNADLSFSGFGIVSRLLAGFVGGLLVANAVAALVSFLIPDRLDAYFITGTLSGMPVVCALLWAFYARSAARAWIVLLAISLCAVLAAYLLRAWGAGA